MDNSAFKNHFILQTKLLKALGLSLENESKWYMIYSYVILVSIFCLPFFATHAILAVNDNFDDLMDNLVFDACYVTTFFKITAMFLMRRKVGKALQLVQSGIFVPNKERNEVEESMINECMFYVNAQTIFICGCAFMSMILGNIVTLSKRISNTDSKSWNLPYGSFALFDVTCSPNFEIVWIYQSIFVAIGGLAFCTIDCFTAGVMAYLCYQCKILQMSIKTSVARIRTKFLQNGHSDEVSMYLPKNSQLEWKYLRQTLKEAVEHHTALIDISNKLGDCFSIEIFINFIGLSILICMSAFYATSVASFNYRLIQKLEILNGAVCMQLITAYWGTELMLQSVAVGDICYEVDFVGTDVKFQKSLYQIMKRAQRPIRFTVGKFAPLTLATFVTVMKASYSYYMLLHNLVKT